MSNGLNILICLRQNSKLGVCFRGYFTYVFIYLVKDRMGMKKKGENRLFR